jgi:hypothetical protein
MYIRRPMSALFVSLALFGGGTLTACSDPTGSRTGTPADTATHSSAANPSDEQQDNLPNNSDPDQGNQENQNDGSQGSG